MIVKLKNVRLAFPQIFEAKPFQGTGEPSFTAMFLLDPKTQDTTLKEIDKSIIAAAKEKWGAKADAILRSLTGTDKLCLRSGDTKAEYAGFEGMMFVSARAPKTRPPYICDRNPEIKLAAIDGRPYGGCYVNATVEIWAQDNGYGKRVNAGLRAIQFYKDGDAFAGGAPVTPDEFDDISDFEGEVPPGVADLL